MKEFGIYLLSVGTAGILSMIGMTCFLINWLMGLAYLFALCFVLGLILIEIGED